MTAVVRLHSPAIGALFGFIAAWSLSSQDFVIKILSDNINIFQIVFVRALFSAIVAFAWAYHLNGGFSAFVTRQPRLVAARIIANLIAFFCFYIALSYLPLTVYTILGFMVFIFTAALTGPLLKEPTGWRSWVAIVAGMFGAFIIVNPTGDGVNLAAAALLLLGAFMWALSIIAGRALGTQMRTSSILFYTNVGLMLAGATGVTAWTTPTTVEWLLLIGVGLFGTIGQGCAINAYRLSRVDAVLPTQYTMLLWASLYGWLWWDSTPDFRLLLGAVLIGSGGLLALPRRRG